MTTIAKQWAQKNNLNYEAAKSPYSFWTHEEKVRDIIWGEIEGDKIFMFTITINRKNLAYPAFLTYFNGALYLNIQYDILDKCAKKIPEEYEKLGKYLWENAATEYQSNKILSNFRPLHYSEKIKVGDKKIAYGDIFSLGKTTERLFPLELIFLLMSNYYLDKGIKMDFEVLKNFYNAVEEVYFEKAGLLRKIINKYFKKEHKNVPYDFLASNKELILQKIKSNFDNNLSRELLVYYCEIVKK